MTEEDARTYGLVGRYLLAYGGDSPVYRPSFADRRRWVLAKHRFNVFPPERGGSFATFSRQLDETRGWFPELGTYTGAQAPRAGFTPGGFASEALRAFCAGAERRRIPVLFWWAPSPEDAYAGDYRERAQQEARAVQSSAPWLRLLQTGPPSWPAGKFGSVTHLTRAGAKEHSEAFGRALKEALASACGGSCPAAGAPE
jgi:hypothetical protein